MYFISSCKMLRSCPIFTTLQTSGRLWHKGLPRVIKIIIIHLTQHLFSDWPKAYSQCTGFSIPSLYLKVFGIYYFRIHEWHSLFIFVKRHYTFLSLKSVLWSQWVWNFILKKNTLLQYVTFVCWYINDYHTCLNPLALKISLVILLTVCHTIHVMLGWRIWNRIDQ